MDGVFPQRCVDMRTFRCYITPQNHGFAIDSANLPGDATAPSTEETNKLIAKGAVKKTLEKIALKSSKPALNLFGDFARPLVNLSGESVLGGSQSDAGLTDRRVIIGTHGG